MNLLKKRKIQTPEEQAEIQFKKIKLKKTDISIDCGANVGKYTKLLAKNKATVYAFEPNPYAFGALSYRFRKSKNVVCINKGVMDEVGKMKLYLHNNSSENPIYWSTSSSFLTSATILDYDSNIEIEVVDLCEFIDSLESKVKVLKMDVEGAEFKIIKKLIKTNTIHKVDHLFVEMHDKFIADWKTEGDEIRNLIKEKGITNINLDWK